MGIMESIPRAAVLEAVPLDRESWLRARNSGIGGSEVAAILGLSPWATPLEVWRRKIGLAPESTSSLRMRRGTHLESWVRDEWAAATGAEVATVPFLRDRSAPHRVASLDGLIIRPGPRVLEVKTAKHRWDDGLPIPYELQVRWYLAMTGLEAALVVMDCGDDALHEYPVMRDEELEGEIIEAVDAWWTDHVVGMVPPDPTTPEERKAVALSRLAGRACEVPATPDAERIVEELLAARAVRDGADAAAKRLEASLAEAMAAAGATKMRGGEWSASVVERPGAIRYAEAVKALGIDAAALEPYRGQAARYVTVRATKAGAREV